MRKIDTISFTLSTKTADMLEDIKPEDYEDSEMFQAARYFEIGQNEDDGMGICWIIRTDGVYSEILKKKGGTHSANWGEWARDLWRGWYDPNQQLMSVVVPPTEPNYKKQIKQVSDIPPHILQTIAKGFRGKKYKIEVF